ncbi:MAG: hypothetical protein RIR07_821 [Bacteroidota bacterium]|jgi:glycerol-3-phosphate dehydrogenase (NAD(P)+)
MGKNPKIAVLGGGSWATAIVKMLTQNEDYVGWWVRREEVAAHIRQHHHNPHYLSDVALETDRIYVDHDLMSVASQAEILVLAVPSAFLAEAIEPLRELLATKWVISAVKGIEPESHQIIGEYLHDGMSLDYSRFGALVGPCHAEEIALERLSYLTVASENQQLAEVVAAKLRGSYVKVRCSSDIYGTEYAAVLKNIYAIAAGLAQGLGYGDNFQAVLVSNALREMKRVIGAVHPIKRQIIQTEYSGDLFVTMYSPFSRNRRLGLLLGKGYSLSAARAEMSMVAEGYYAAKLIREVKREREVKMPIASAVYKVLYEKASPKKTLRALAEKLK